MTTAHDDSPRRSQLSLRVSQPLDSGAQDLDDVFERVIEVMGQGVTITGLEMSKPMKRAAERSRRVDSVDLIEAIPHEGQTESLDDVLDGLFEFGISCTWVTIRCRKKTRPLSNHLAPGTAHGPYGIIGRDPHRCLAKSLFEQLATLETETSHQIVVPVDMAIQRRLTDPQIACDTGERQSVEALFVGDLACDGKNDFCVELGATIAVGGCHKVLQFATFTIPLAVVLRLECGDHRHVDDVLGRTTPREIV